MEARGSPGKGRAGVLLGAANVRSRRPLGGRSPQWAGWRPGSCQAHFRLPASPGNQKIWLFLVWGLGFVVGTQMVRARRTHGLSVQVGGHRRKPQVI